MHQIEKGFFMLFWILMSVFGCRNQCQRLCYEMQEFAEDCGYQFTDEMLKECLENQGEKQKENKEACKEARPKLQEEWTCEDLDVYFDNNTAQDESSDE